MLPPGPTGKTRADGARDTFLRGPTAIQELIEPMVSGKPYPIKGLLIYGMNIFHTLPNQERTRQALRNLELVVSIDVLPQDHIAWSDVVLPEASYLERYDDVWACAHKTPYIALREPAIAPQFDTKPGWWMARELGNRLGLEAFFPWENAEEFLNRRLSSAGLSIEKLHAQGGIAVQPGKPYLADFEADKTSPFGTANQKIELYSDALAKSKLAPLPVYEATPEPPAGYFRLLYGRSPVHTFARTQNTPLLNELMPENEVWLSAIAAARLGLKNGDKVSLENQDKIKVGPIRVKVTERIRSDAVYMVHGFGHVSPEMKRANRRGQSDTALQSKYALDPICGGAGLRVNFVRLIKDV